MPTLPKQTVKTIRLTEDQVRVLCEALTVIAEASKADNRIRFVRMYKRRMVPSEALRNVVGWLERKLEEQNGGERITMAWDFQEDT